MRDIFRTLLAAMLLAAALAGPARAQEAQTLVVNLTTDDVWTSQMALGFARAVQNDGGDVVVFLNVRAVALANEGVPQHTYAASGKTPPEMIAEIVGAGGRVYLCPGCTEQAGLDPERRVDGVEMGGPGFREIVMAPGTRIMSY